jgi:hypothetical protein
MQRSDRSMRRIWLAALACFVLAGMTGSLLRFGMLSGFPAGLQLLNVRHAHSHLMYFGWVTPALMALIASSLPAPPGRRLSRLLGSILVAALAAYVSFLFTGYRPVTLGESSLPLSTMLAGLNVLLWYGFVIGYRRATKGLPRFPWLRLWDAALGFLVLSSLGAWGLALSNILGMEEPLWSLALSHLFLDLFADGWFVLALLGLAYAAFPQAASQRAAHWGETLLIAGLPLTFLLSLPATSLPVAVRWVVGAAALLVGAGLLASVYALILAAWRQARLWLVPLAFLALKAAAEIVMSVPAGAAWAGSMALRIPYLHWLLLGFVTLGLAAAAEQRWGRRAVPGRSWLVVTVLLLQLSLLPLTLLWPASLGNSWALPVAAWASLGPVLVATGMLLRQLHTRRPGAEPSAALEV